MSAIQTSLSDILHFIAQNLLVPTIVILIALILYAIFIIGSVIAEFFSERKRFKIAMPQFLASLMAAKQEELPKIVEESGLLNRQKKALLTVYDYRMLPGDAFVALIRRLVSQEETRYDRITGRVNMAAKISPMVGLMGTLIPLGPGIEALGRSDTAALSSSLLVAFDTTVAGLIVAAVCLVIGKIRSNWYSDYMNALDSAMATMMEKIEDMRSAGLITISEPSDYAFIFEQSHGKSRRKKNRDSDTEHDAAPNPGQPVALPPAGDTAAWASHTNPATPEETPFETIPAPSMQTPYSDQVPTPPYPMQNIPDPHSSYPDALTSQDALAHDPNSMATSYMPRSEGQFQQQRISPNGQNAAMAPAQQQNPQQRRADLPNQRPMTIEEQRAAMAARQMRARMMAQQRAAANAPYPTVQGEQNEQRPNSQQGGRYV